MREKIYGRLLAEKYNTYLELVQSPDSSIFSVFDLV